jgi:MerR family transcriptional regulator, light-induced transcriptional regulator
MSNLKCLTTKEVARLCRVSDATVKRWEDGGLLRSERTSGGHRRFRAEEVARFQRQQNLGLKQCYGDESVAKAKSRRLEIIGQTGSPLFNALLAGCEEESLNLLLGAYLEGVSVTKIFDDLLCPAMNRIGQLWFDNQLTVTQEHLATRTAFNAVHKLRNALSVPRMNENLAFCGAFENDIHDLPTYLAQVTMENEGWEVMNFGANTPLYSLHEEILQHAPQVVCISATFMGDIERLARDYREFRETAVRLKIPIILGGAIFKNNCVRQRFPAEFYAESFADVADFVERWSK